MSKTLKILSFQVFAFLIAIDGITQEGKPSSSPGIKTFALQQDISGPASNSVNLFTGDVALPMNLVSLPGHNGLDVSVSISYGSNIQNIVDNWNLESPAGILGLGWSMDIPKIISDHKQTGTREDDDYYLLIGGSSNKLIRAASGSDAEGSYYTYETKSYNFWKIRFYYDPAELGYNGSGANKWVIIQEDGSKYIYGDKNSNRKTIQWMVRWGNWIGNSSQLIGQSQFVYIWNLSEIVNLWNERVTFEYDNVEQFVGSASGQKHTEASYLKKITDVLGRKVVFYYNDKQPPYYIEPHIEQSEPDAYQEFYEKKYLDRLEVLDESDIKILAVQFKYKVINAATNSAKMLLASIIQKNANGNSLPGMKFDYYQSGNTKGFLSTITYPTGGTINYTYTSKTLGHSNREFTATAPAGYAEPRVWLGEDYAVVTWRQLGSGNSHDDNPRDVKLCVYQWVGEWKEQFLQTISGVSLEGDQTTGWNKDYKDFQVAIQKDFFAVLSRAGSSSNVYNLFIRYKDRNNRGVWSNYTTGFDYGTGTPNLMSGTNFIAVGSFQDDATHPSHLFTFQGNNFKDDILNQSIGDHYYTSANNYFISHNRAGVDGYPEINFNYLTEDKKWTTKNWGSWLEFSSTATSYWYGENSMAICMANNNPEYAYRWDLTYTNFFRDAQDKNNNDLFGGLNDASRVFIINNSLVGIYGRLARYDGKDWSTATITSTYSGGNENGSFFSYGDDYVVRPVELAVGYTYKGGRKTFNPNTLNWESDVIMQGADQGKDFANAGIDYYYFGNGYYYRQPNGTWVKKYTYPTYDFWTKGGWPRFEVLHGIQYKDISEVRFFKNGEISSPLYLYGRHLFYHPYKFKSNGVGNQTLITYSNAFSANWDATYIYLHRFVNEALAGSQTDFPVTLITTNDGISNSYFTIDYNTATASVDPSGTIAQYNEVTEIQGSSLASNKPYGYTKTFFYNGLTDIELGVPYMPVDLLWNGLPYKKEIYDKNNLLKAHEKTTFQTFSKNIQNDLGTQVFI
ncbi:MAG TPA: hypothetical protein VI461_17730, partial [Chitinophagaceae bacterium]|nr:hypothetical protein [Chitinophagaceae bacterium]